uniref:ATP synthase complex subunit 8 n=1 Tax=Neomegalotomus parvus TaxID=1985200 RepID=A0A343YVK7_9HEMI|nr:ATP synthase F0 subunit 8 [Neomegalotomus parvus]
MPQMAPLWWELLFIMFIIMFMLMNMIIYYNKNITINNKKNCINYKNYNWKW